MKPRSFINSIDQWNGQGVLSLLGPTSSGKTAAALNWVKKNHTQNKQILLISVDAVTVYSGLNVGSAKPSSQELTDFNWAGIDIFQPNEEANVRKFIDAVQPKLQNALQSKTPIIVVGGSFFYERALVDGMAPGDRSDPEFIRGLSAKSNEDILKDLIKIDARWRDRLHENDRYRLERYSDLTIRQGFKFDQLFTDSKADGLQSITDLPIKTLVMGMETNRDQYLIRLQSRMEEMFRAGWLAEVQGLIEKYSSEIPALQTVGYQQITHGLKAKNSLAKIADDILLSHIQLVKKQKTWLRGLMAKQ